MSSSRKSILRDLLSPDEKESLKGIYLSRGISTDNLRRIPGEFAGLVQQFRAATGRADISPNLLLRYILNRRKQKDWPRIGKRARKFESVLTLLNASQTAVLRTICETMAISSDELFFSPAHIRRVETMFREKTGTPIEGAILVAIIFAKRKRGEWTSSRSTTRAFSDIEIVARQSSAS